MFFFSSPFYVFVFNLFRSSLWLINSFFNRFSLLRRNFCSPKSCFHSSLLLASTSAANRFIPFCPSPTFHLLLSFSRLFTLILFIYYGLLVFLVAPIQHIFFLTPVIELSFSSTPLYLSISSSSSQNPLHLFRLNSVHLNFRPWIKLTF